MIPSENPIIQQVGQRIKDAREAKNMTQKELADRVDVSRTAVTQWEASMTFPNLEKIIELSKILSVSPEFIAFNRDKPVEYRTPTETSVVPVLQFGEKVEDRKTLATHYMAKSWMESKGIVGDTAFFVRIESEAFAARYAPGSLLLIDGAVERFIGDGDYLIWNGFTSQLVNLSANFADPKTVVVQSSIGGAGQPIDAKKLTILGRVKGVLN